MVNYKEDGWNFKGENVLADIVTGAILHPESPTGWERGSAKGHDRDWKRTGTVGESELRFKFFALTDSARHDKPTIKCAHPCQA